jgi:hypothetical protein
MSKVEVATTTREDEFQHAVNLKSSQSTDEWDNHENLQVQWSFSTQKGEDRGCIKGL